MKKLTSFLLLFLLAMACQAQTITESQKRLIAIQVKQVLQDFKMNFCMVVNPKVDSPTRIQATNELWASIREDARFENDLIPDNRGSRTIDFSEYLNLAQASYPTGDGLGFDLEWEEAELKTGAEGTWMLVYGHKTLYGKYNGKTEVHLESIPCRARVYVTLRGDQNEFLEGKIGFLDTDVKKGTTFSLITTTNPLEYVTLDEAISTLGNQLSGQLPKGVVQKISIETLTYTKSGVRNEFSDKVTGYLKSSIGVKNPNIEVTVLNSRSFEAYMTLRGSYKKQGNFLVLEAQFYNSANQPVGQLASSKILLKNLGDAPIEPTAKLLAVAEKDQEVIKKGITTTTDECIKLELITNRGAGSQLFVEKETMTVSVRVEKPCLIRLVYRDSVDSLLLMMQDFSIDEKQVNSWVTLPESFTCSGPFGVELLWAFATQSSFSPLHTLKVGDYTYILDEMETIKAAKNAPGSSAQTSTCVAEQSISITTRPLAKE